MSSYSLIDHTADLRVVIEAENKRELFHEAVKALFFMLTDKTMEEIDLRSRYISRRVINIAYNNIDDALIDFLNQLVFFVDTEQILPYDARIQIKKNKVHSRVFFLKDYNNLLQREIKAATFHNFKIEESEEGFKTLITFDI
jgi:SHS2 domain-containing protein